MQIRKIIHIDMDAFYASVEQRDDPSLRGKAIAVGGNSGRGVVMTASYEARKFGVKSAMPSGVALRLCPHLIFVKSRMDAYKEASNIIRAIFKDYTDLVEPLSLDEAYLDVTQDNYNIGSATLIAKAIRERIFEQTHLTASAGVSYNKFLAKLASDMQKPNGQTLILPQNALEILAALPIEKFHGIGKVTAEKMHALNIRNGQDLRSRPLKELIARFGKAGHYYYNAVRGIDEREVKPNRIRKSIGAETTFSADKTSFDALCEDIKTIADKVYERAQIAQMSGRTLTLKIKFSDFEIKTRRVTTHEAFNSVKSIYETAIPLLKSLDLNGKSIRLLGLSLSNLSMNNAEQSEQQQNFNF